MNFSNSIFRKPKTQCKYRSLSSEFKVQFVTLIIILAIAQFPKIIYCQVSDGGKTRPFSVKPYGGIATGTGKFHDYALPGYGLGIAADYLIKNRLGFVMETDYFRNEFRRLPVLQRIPQNTMAYTITSDVLGHWSAFVVALGPTYNIPGRKFSSDYYSKVGVAWVTTPEAWAKLSFNSVNAEFFRMNRQRFTTLSLTTGIRLNYQMSPKFSVFLNPQHIYTNAKVLYSLRNAEPAFSLDQNGKEIFNQGTLAEQKLEEKSLYPNYLNVNVGLSIGISQRKDRPASVSELQNNGHMKKNRCLPATITNPEKYNYIYLDQKRRPDFAWTDNNKRKAKSYTLVFTGSQFKANNNYHSVKSNSAGIKHNKDLEDFYQKYFAGAKQKELKIYVISHFTDCEDQVSEPVYLVGSERSSGLTIDFRNSSCRIPAFDQSGQVHYRAEVTLINPAGNSTTLIIPSCNFTVNDINGNNTVNTVQGAPPGMTGTWPSCPITLLPGQQQVVYFSFSQPFGQSRAFLNVPYHSNTDNVLITERESDSLPNCVCNICDDWSISANNSAAWAVNWPHANVRVRNTLALSPGVQIAKVKAEIVNIAVLQSDTLCSICAKSDETMGLFRGAQNSGTIISNLGFSNQGRGILRDEDGDGYGNEYSWESDNDNGTFFTQPRTFFFNLNLPQRSKLTCCTAVYRICIRYTFTDVLCRSCSVVECVTYDGLVPGRGNNGDAPTDTPTGDSGGPVKPEKK